MDESIIKGAQQQKLQLWVIVAIVFFGFLGISMPYLIFPSLFLNAELSILPLETTEGARAFWLGVALASYPLGQFLGSPILGALSDERGRRPVLVISLLLASLFTLLSAAALVGKIFWLLIASRFAAGFMEGNLSIARAMAADLKMLNKHDSFGKINAAASIAFLLGPMVGGVLSDRELSDSFSLPLPFFIVAFLFLLLALLSRFALSRRPLAQPREARSLAERINFIARLRRLFTIESVRRSLIAATLFTLAVDIFYQFAPVYLTVKWQLRPAELALYNGALCLALAIGSGALAGRLSARYESRKIIACSIALFSLSLTAIGVTSSRAAMFLFFTMAGFAISVATTSLTVKLSDAASDEIQGEVMGVQLSLRVLGEAVICLLGGLILSISPALLLFLAAIVSLLPLSRRSWREGRELT